MYLFGCTSAEGGKFWDFQIALAVFLMRNRAITTQFEEKYNRFMIQLIRECPHHLHQCLHNFYYRS